MAANDLDKAMALLRKGAAADRNSARVSIMMGRVWMEKGDYAKAVESLERVIDQDKELVGETLEMLQTCYQQLGKTDEWEVFLRRCVEKRRGDRRTDAGADPEQREGVEAAQNYVTRQLERHPTMRVFHKLMDYHLNEAEEGRAKESLGCCETWLVSRCAANHAIAARNAGLPLIHSTGIVRPAARGRPLNPFAVSTASKAKKSPPLVTTYLSLHSSSGRGPAAPSSGQGRYGSLLFCSLHR